MKDRHLNKLEVGDYVLWCYNDVPQTTSIVSVMEINKVEESMRIWTGNTDIIIDTDDKWNNLVYVPIEDTYLSLIGFKPDSTDTAYGTTANKWVLNGLGRNWTLKHELHVGWKLSFKETIDGESRFSKVKKNIAWLYEIQHYLRNPQLMEEE